MQAEIDELKRKLGELEESQEEIDEELGDAEDVRPRPPARTVAETEAELAKAEAALAATRR